MKRILLLLLLSLCGSSYAQIGVTESQIVNRWKGGIADLVGKQIDFPHGNHGCGVTLDYVVDPVGSIKFEAWHSDCEFSPGPVLKQSEPGYTWNSSDGRNWFGHAKKGPELHAFYRDARSIHVLDIATLADAPDRGEGGLELMDLENSAAPTPRVSNSAHTPVEKPTPLTGSGDEQAEQSSTPTTAQTGRKSKEEMEALLKTNAKTSIVRVPFVGCPSDGQGGPNPAPKRAGKEVALDAGAARRLAYYESESSVGVLAPRGWHGFGNYGSSGTSLTVSPYSLTFGKLDTLNGPFIMVTQLSGETSGRFRVARVIARVFPTQREFAEGVIKEGVEPASDFPFGPYPRDTLKYHGDVTVEFQTPANTIGLGTDFGLEPNDQPINGVAAIKWDGEDIYLVCLTVRLMPDTRDLTTEIIQQFERDHELP